MNLKVLSGILLLSAFLQTDEIRSNTYDVVAQCVSEARQSESMKSVSRRDIKKLCSCMVENDNERISAAALGEKCVNIVFNTPKENKKEYKNNYADTNRIQISVNGRKKIVNDSNECTIFYNDNGMGFNRALSTCNCYYDPSTNKRFSNNFSMVSRYCNNNNPQSKFTRQPTQAELDYQLRMMELMQRNRQPYVPQSPIQRQRPSFGEKFNNRLEDRMIESMTDDIFRNDLGYD